MSLDTRKHLWSSRDQTTKRTSGGTSTHSGVGWSAVRPQASPCTTLLLLKLELLIQKQPRPEEEKGIPLPPAALLGCKAGTLIPWRLARGPHLEQPLEQGHGAGGHMQVEVAQETAAQEGELPVQRGAAGQRDG